MGNNVPIFEIRLLGRPQLSLNGRSIDNLRRKNRALIFYVAAQEGQVARERLLSFFWPDHERTAAMPILRTMIHELRKNLGEAFYADDENIRLSPDAFIDLRDFSTALQSPSSNQKILTDALSLYRGEFLEGFSLSDSAQFDDWANSERERFQVIAMNGFARLARMHEEQGDFAIALELMQHALTFNLFQEDLQRDMMRLQYLNGDRAAVIRQYESLRKLLDEELGVPPMPETRTLYDSIINETLVVHAAGPSNQTLPTARTIEKAVLPLMGREVELEKLKGQLRSGNLILLEGEPGIGKTRLATELIALQTRGMTSAIVLHGKSYELGQGLPYLPVLDALRELLARPDLISIFKRMHLEHVWLAELSRLVPELLTRFPEIPPPTAHAEEALIWEALCQLFRGLCRLGEVWLFLDDLHWADAATIGWLGYLIRNISSPSLILLSTSRPHEEPAYLVTFLHSLIRENRLVQVQLSALPESVLQQMGVILSNKNNKELSGWLIENAEGNPFFIIELVRYAYSIGLLKQDGTLDMELLNLSPAIPATIQNLIQSRLLKLTENARQVLHISAIIGREFNFEIIRQVSSLPDGEILDSIDELQAAHLIVPLVDEKLAFDHYLTMQASLSDMTEPRRHFLHRHVAESLETIYQSELDPISGVIAQHFESGNLPQRAQAYLVRAGRHAAKLAAWVEAIAFYQQALTRETDDTKRAEILIAVGAAHFHKGDFAAASNDYQLALELLQACQDWSLLEDAYMGLAISLYPQARFGEAIDMAKRLREKGPPELGLCAEFIWGASLGVESAHPQEAEAHLRKAEQLRREQAGTFESKVTPTEIMYSLAGVFGQQGRHLEAIEQFREVLDIIERGEGTLDTLRNIMLYNNLGYYLHLCGDASAMGYVEKGIKLARERGSLSHLPYLYSTSGEIAMSNGDLDTAEKFFEEGLALANQIPIRERIAGMTANLGLVARQRGEIELARKRLQAALILVEPLGNHHLEARIQIWLAPMLPAEEARACLNSAQVLAEQGGLNGLLAEIEVIRKQIA